MLITIAIINYNYGRFLKQAIESALIQQSNDYELEVLVVDDGSTDNSDEVASTFKSNEIVRISKTKNQGFAASLSRAVAESKGDYVFLMDADDYFAPGKVAAFVPVLKSGYFYLCDTSTYVDGNGALIGGGAMGSTSTVAINKQAASVLLPVENEISFFSLFKLGKGKILEESYTYYRVHSSSMTDRKSPGKWQTYLAGVTSNLADRLLEIAAAGKFDVWNVKKQDVMKVAYEFKSQACYSSFEATLEQKAMGKAAGNYYQMVNWSLRAGQPKLLFHLKMLVRLLLLKPTKKKN